LGESLVVARFPDGSLLAARNACPHKGYDLSKSHICNGRLQCGYHGWRFNSAGECQDIPSLVNPPANKLQLSHLQNFAVQERYGMIWVRLSEHESAPLPEVPEFENPDWTYIVAPPMRFQSGSRREVENYLDMSHFATDRDRRDPHLSRAIRAILRRPHPECVSHCGTFSRRERQPLHWPKHRGHTRNRGGDRLPQRHRHRSGQ
jgi:phenylpropionate dioxygenase-like ring-hydroxylating dioxygenase large terminal subunit